MRDLVTTLSFELILGIGFVSSSSLACMYVHGVCCKIVRHRIGFGILLMWLPIL